MAEIGGELFDRVFGSSEQVRLPKDSCLRTKSRRLARRMVRLAATQRLTAIVDRSASRYLPPGGSFAFRLQRQPFTPGKPAGFVRWAECLPERKTEASAGQAGEIRGLGGVPAVAEDLGRSFASLGGFPAR